MCYVLFRVAIMRNAIFLFPFGLLLGANLFEWQIGLYLSPVILFSSFRAIRVARLNSAYCIAIELAGLAIGVAGYLFATQLLLADQGVSPFLPIHELITSLKYGISLLLGGVFESNPLLSSFCFAVLPFLATIAISLWQGDGALLFSFALAGLPTLCCSDLSISPWGAARAVNSDTLPVASYVFNAAIASYLVGYCALLSGGHFFPTQRAMKKRDREEEISDELRDSPAARLLLWYLSLLILCTASLNYLKSTAWHDSLLNRIAQRSVEEIPDRSMVLMEVNDLDSLVRIHAYLQDKRIIVLDPFSARALPLFQKALDLETGPFADLSEDDKETLRGNLSEKNPLSFIAQWIKLDPMAGDKLEIMQPDTITHVGKDALPSLFGYRATQNADETDWASLAEHHLAFWRELETLPGISPMAPFWLRDSHLAAQRQILAVGAYLASELEKRKQPDQAKETRLVLDRLERHTVSNHRDDSSILY